MTTDVLDFDVEPAAATPASAPTPAPAASTSTDTASTAEVAAVASGSLASDPTSASAAPSDSYTLGTSETFDVMESQLDLREPKTKQPDAAVADATATAKVDAAAPAAAADATAAGLEHLSATDISLARHYGFTDAELKAIKTPDALQSVLTALDRRELSAGNPSQSQPAATVEDRSAAKPGDEVAAPNASLSQSDLEIEPLDLDLSNFDDEAAAILQKIADHQQAQLAKLAARVAPQSAPAEVAALQEKLAALEQETAYQRKVQFERDMDSFFTGLGPEYADKFGEGPVRSLAADSKHLAARNELVREFAALREADARLGRPPMPQEQILKRALAARYADQVQELARKQVRNEVQERRAQAVERPTSRTNPVETGDAAAVGFLNRFLKDRGVETDSSLSELLAEIE